MKKSELIAKSSDIHTTISEFTTALKNFKRDVNAKFNDIIEISNNVAWTGTEAQGFKNAIKSSSENVSVTLNGTDEIVKKLDAKAAQWSALLEKLKKN